MGKRIMTVDDSAAVRQMLHLTLSEAGYAVIAAGKNAGASARIGKPFKPGRLLPVMKMVLK